ncbi:MAG: DUF2167 domain-containing protein [Pseudomonadota bacterium]
MPQLVAVFLLFISLAFGVRAEDAGPAPDQPSPSETAAMQQLVELESSFKYQTGTVDLPGGKAQLKLGDAFRYLGPEDTRRLLVEGWGNPEVGTTWGMILPAGVHPFSPDGWGVIVTYESDGHVSDDDANTIDYAQLLKDMQESTRAESDQRVGQGFPALELVGWAQAPSYDATGRRLHWAKEIHFGDAAENTLNYNIRVLGREGVLVLNAVAGMNQFQDLRPALEQVVTSAEFTEGNRYDDYQEGTDKLAGYGLAALVAGGLVAKTGKLALLLVFAKKFLGVILLALAGMGGWLFKRFRQKPAA